MRRPQSFLAIFAALVLAAHALILVPARAYVLNRTVAAPHPQQDGCPKLNRFNVATAGIIDRRWSTSLGTSPQTIFTSATESAARLNEIEDSIKRAYDVWASVAGSSLTLAAYEPLQRTNIQDACTFNDGLNSVCLNQASGSFSGTILAFARVITSDILGEAPFPGSPPSQFIGEILDADIFFRQNDNSRCFATPGVLTTARCANGTSLAHDFESVLIHEIGHTLGFSHSGVWRAMMYPFAPPRATFLGDRPTQAVPDGPLHDDDRAGLRVLYPDAGAPSLQGRISGRILPANPLTLSQLPQPAPGEFVTGIFGAHVVAIDTTTGGVAASVVAGWSCQPGAPHPTFDGFYEIGGLPVGRSYRILAEPLDGPTNSSDYAMFSAGAEQLCRPDLPQPCSLPAIQTNFTTRVRPAP